jgi:hypothetical protein
MRRNSCSPPGDCVDFHRKLVEARAVCFRFRAKQYINPSSNGQYSRPRQLTEPALYAIPVYNVSSVFRNNHTNPWMKQQGSGRASFETLGLHPLPCTSYRFQIGLSRQPGAARKAERLTRRRI